MRLFKLGKLRKITVKTSIKRNKNLCWLSFLSYHFQIVVHLYNIYEQEMNQISLVQSCPALCNPMDCSRPDFPVLYHLPELAQTHVHWVYDAIQPSCPLSPLLLVPSISSWFDEIAIITIIYFIDMNICQPTENMYVISNSIISRSKYLHLFKAYTKHSLLLIVRSSIK